MSEERGAISKTIQTLIPDIYALFTEEHRCTEENLDWFADNLKVMLRHRFAETQGNNKLRMSNLGKGDRSLWYDVNGTHRVEEMRPNTLLKFMYGDLIELLLLFLTREAGHTVTHEQERVEVDGVVGHTDGKIDGVTCDIKSASPYGYNKFADETIYDNDAFGYIPQISGYNHVLGEKGSSAYFLVMHKVLGHLCLMEVPDIMQINVPARITQIKGVLAKPEPPERCYEAIPEGKSGNLKLGVNCQFCDHKWECWKDGNGGKGLRQFIYSNGPTWLTHVEKEPRVMETFREKA